ncbi:MAG: hypothetical protein U9N54_07910 [candidate division Zixibacteria bacterium]|nr:hypothetical protein [candidate division Zixibacteria bacterium]
MKRIDNIEFRWSNYNKKYELVQWKKWGDHENGEFRFVLAFYNKGSEGYEISFVGDRPFKVEDTNLLWKMLKFGQNVCNAEFDMEEEL